MKLVLSIVLSCIFLLSSHASRGESSLQKEASFKLHQSPGIDSAIPEEKTHFVDFTHFVENRIISESVSFTEKSEVNEKYQTKPLPSSPRLHLKLQVFRN